MKRSLAHLRFALGRARLFGPRFGWFRATRLAFLDRPGSEGEFTLEWPGYRSKFVMRAGGSDLLTFFQVIASNGYSLPFDLEAPPRVIIDAGANVGYSAIWFAGKYPTARIYAIEPERDNFHQMLTNIASYEAIVPLQAALWPTDEDLYLGEHHGGSMGFRTTTLTGTSNEVSDGNAISTVTLEQLIGTYGIEKIDVLKIDIEGSEKELFEGDTQWLDRVGAIAIELHDRFKPGCSSAFDRATQDFILRVTKHDETFVRRP